jgi:hypothetical protein
LLPKAAEQRQVQKIKANSSRIDKKPKTRGRCSVVVGMRQEKETKLQSIPV